MESLEKLNEPLRVRSCEWRTNKNSHCKIVIDDLVIAQEGNTINADGEITQQ
jgi:Ca2+-transporting ATPase